MTQGKANSSMAPDNMSSPAARHGKGHRRTSPGHESDEPRQLRLLCVLHDLRVGGAELGALTLLEALASDGFNVTLFCLSAKGDLSRRIPANVRVVHGSTGKVSPKLLLLPILGRLYRLARWSDVVFAAQEGASFYAAVLMGRVARRPIVGSLRTSWTDILQDLPAWHRPVSRVLYPAADAIVTASETVRQDIVSFLGRLELPIHVIPSFRDQTEVRLRGTEPLPGWAKSVFARPVLVSVGRLERVKGFDRLILAFSQAVRDGLEANLLIVGEGSLRPQLESIVEQHGLRDRVSLPGFSENPYPLLSRSLALVVTSHYEGSPSVMIEAMALGLPILAFDCPHGPREMLAGGTYGVLIQDGDQASLAGAMHRIVGEEGLREGLSRLGLVRSKDFDAQSAIDRYRSLFLRLARSATRL